MTKLEERQIKLAKKIANMSPEESAKMKARVDRQVDDEMSDL